MPLPWVINSELTNQNFTKTSDLYDVSNFLKGKKMDQFLGKKSLVSLNTKLFLSMHELLKLLVAGRLENSVGKLHLSACLFRFLAKHLPLAMPRGGSQAKWLFQIQ